MLKEPSTESVPLQLAGYASVSNPKGESMYPVNSYDGITQRLSQKYWESEGRHLTGIVFAHPGFKIVKDEIIPFIRKYHLRSGDHVHFFFSGYLTHDEGKDDYMGYGDCEEIDGGAEGDNWYFSDAAFENLRSDIEKLSKWKHSGGVDLLLLDGIYKDSYMYRGFDLDFSQVVSINLAESREEKIIPMIPSFFEDIFRYADQTRHEASIWDYSDKQIPNLCVLFFQIVMHGVIVLPF
ncbi:hypothetical protein ACFL2V_19305 [Pseudomonadota bacterium]